MVGVGDVEIPADFRQLLAVELPFDDEAAIRELFGTQGDIKRCRVLPRRTDKSTSAAYLTMATHEQAQSAIDEFHRKCINGSEIRVLWDTASLGFSVTSKNNYNRARDGSTDHNIARSDACGGIPKQFGQNSDGNSTDKDKLNLYCKVDGKEMIVGSFDPQIIAALVPTKTTNGFGHAADRSNMDNTTQVVSTPASGTRETSLSTENKHEEDGLTGRRRKPLPNGVRKMGQVIAENGNHEDGYGDNASSCSGSAKVDHSLPKTGMTSQSTLAKPDFIEPGPEPLGSHRRQRIQLDGGAIHKRVPEATQHKPALEGQISERTPTPEPAVRQRKFITLDTLPAQRRFSRRPVTISKEVIVPATRVKEGTVFDGPMKHVVKKNEFWIHMQWVEEDLPVAHVWVSERETCEMPAYVVEMNDDLTDFYSKVEKVITFRPRVDQPVAVFVDGKTWTRGVVTEIFRPSGGTFVELIDMGGFECIDDSTSSRVDIQPLDARFAAESPPLALRAHVAGINLSEYDSGLSDSLRRLFCQNEIVRPKLARLEKLAPLLQIRIFEPVIYPYPVDFCTLLIRERENKKPNSAGGVGVELGLLLNVPDPSVTPENLYDFLMVDIKDMAVLEGLQENLKKMKLDLPVDTKFAAVNGVKYTDDNLYRCFMAAKQDTKGCDFSVELLDFGDHYRAPCNSVFGLPKELRDLESPSMMCRLDCDGYDRHLPRLEDMKGLVCAYRVVKKVDDYLTVQIWDPRDMAVVGLGLKIVLSPQVHSGKIWEWKHPSKCGTAIPVTAEILTVKDFKYVVNFRVQDVLSVTPAFVLDGEMFIAVPEPAYLDSPEFLAMMDDLQSRCDDLPCLKEVPVVDTAVYARFSGDNQWYRAIISVAGKGNFALVFFVDYGNREKLPISEIRLMDSKWMHLPRCTLTLVDEGYSPPDGDNWSADALTEITSLVHKKSCRFEVADVIKEFGLITGRLYFSEEGTAEKMTRLSDALVQMRIACAA